MRPSRGPRKDFYPRPPRGGRPAAESNPLSNERNFYPRPPRGGRRYTCSAWSAACCNFYPRPPRGGRQTPDAQRCVGKRFLSTPSARRATVGILPNEGDRTISIHALREEGDQEQEELAKVQDISIHALREEGDFSADYEGIISVKFLSTPSARRATPREGGGQHRQRISIHALREEGDSCRRRIPFPGRYFYPRPPRGGRPSSLLIRRVLHDISIHALREEGDAWELRHVLDNLRISIHALREEGDSKNRDKISIFL